MIEAGTAGKHVIGEETTSSVVRAHTRDGRDWLRELWEEQADAVIYILIASLVANPAGRRSAAPEQRSTLRVVWPADVDPPRSNPR